MKNIAKTYSIAALLLSMLLALPTACIQEESAASTENATVMMTFTTRTATTGSKLPANEQMKTLRVIMAKSNSNTILYNVFYRLPEDTYSKTITFNDIPVTGTSEDYDFYAIANEASFKDDVDETTGESTSLQGFNVPLYNVEKALTTERINIDLDPTEDNPLPQTAKQRVTIYATEGTQTAEIPLKFVCAKASVVFYNETGSEQTISDLKIAGLAQNLGNLFHSETPPGGTTALDVLFGTADAGSTSRTVTVPADAEGYKADSVYFYRSTVSLSNYNLTATWKDKQQTLSLGSENIARSTHLRIEITLKNADVEIAYHVLDWVDTTPHEIDWSDNYVFTLESATQVAGNEEDGYYFPIKYNTLNDDTYANDLVLYFRLTSPEGAIWKASIDNGQDFYFVNPDNEEASPDDTGYTAYVPEGETVANTVPATPIRLRAFGADYNSQTARLAIRVMNAAGEWRRIIINPENKYGPEKDVISIKRVPNEAAASPDENNDESTTD